MVRNLGVPQAWECPLRNKTWFEINTRQNASAKMLPVQVSMDVTSLYTNIPQEEGITIICKAYETFYRNEPETPDTQAT